MELTGQSPRENEGKYNARGGDGPGQEAWNGNSGNPGEGSGRRGDEGHHPVEQRSGPASQGQSRRSADHRDRGDRREHRRGGQPDGPPESEGSHHPRKGGQLGAESRSGDRGDPRADKAADKVLHPGAGGEQAGQRRVAESKRHLIGMAGAEDDLEEKGRSQQTGQWDASAPEPGDGPRHIHQNSPDQRRPGTHEAEVGRCHDGRGHGGTGPPRQGRQDPSDAEGDQSHVKARKGHQMHASRSPIGPHHRRAVVGPAPQEKGLQKAPGIRSESLQTPFQGSDQDESAAQERAAPTGDPNPPDEDRPPIAVDPSVAFQPAADPRIRGLPVTLEDHRSPGRRLEIDSSAHHKTSSSEPASRRESPGIVDENNLHGADRRAGQTGMPPGLVDLGQGPSRRGQEESGQCQKETRPSPNENGGADENRSPARQHPGNPRRALGQEGFEDQKDDAAQGNGRRPFVDRGRHTDHDAPEGGSDSIRRQFP